MQGERREWRENTYEAEEGYYPSLESYVYLEQGLQVDIRLVKGSKPD